MGVVWEVVRCLGRCGCKQYVFVGSALNRRDPDAEKCILSVAR